MAMSVLHDELKKLRTRANLSQAATEADKLIEMLTNAREEIASADEQHSAALSLAKLQNRLNSQFESITDALRPVDRGQKAYGRALDKSFPSRPLPTSCDAMADQFPLINRAIAMHLLREGQFDVAQTFLRETQPVSSSIHHDSQSTAEFPGSGDEMAPFYSQILQREFATMYKILSCMRNRDLIPAITWATQESAALEARGSNLEFELKRLQFIYLFLGGRSHTEQQRQQQQREDDFLLHLAPTPSSRHDALKWAQHSFIPHQPRHTREIQRLASAVVFADNITCSPYSPVFDPTNVRSAFDNAAGSFTRDFCSLLGLSSESPLYVAATAGSVALPQLLKYTSRIREKGTEWTTAEELAFETPLPTSMVYHPIFVCPVSKEQTTATNPPVMLPCGHVVARQSLHCLLKGTKAKCPYCPVEGHKDDARAIEIL